MAMAKVNCLLCLWLMVLATKDCSFRSENLTLPEVALFITREHLSNLTSTVVIAENSITSESANANAQLIEYILQRLDARIAIQFYMIDYLNQPLEYYIIIVDSLEAFKGIRNMLADNFYERKFRFLIIITVIAPSLWRTMIEIFEICYDFNVIDANIITVHPTEGFVAMFTYFLYAENVCRRRLPIVLHNFRNGFENFTKLFPEKLKNFHGCPLKVGARAFPPFFSFEGNRNDPKPVGAWENLWGIEGTLLKYLAETLNFTIDLQSFPDERSYVKDNRTFGCFTELIKRRVDIAVGGFVDSNSNRWIFSPTNSYHNSLFVYVVRGKTYVSSLQRLAMPFTYHVWCVLGAFLFLSIAFIMVLKIIKLKVHHFIFGEESRHPLTNFLSICLGYPVRRTPRRNFARYIFSHLLFLTLILRNAYQGSLYDAFRMDRFASYPSGYDDLIKWNYTILLPPESKQLIIFPKHRVITIDSETYEMRLEMLDRLNGKYATVVLQDGFINYLQKNTRNKTEIISLPEIILNYQFVMYLSKHSIYLSIFNSQLKALAAAGIMTKVSANYTSTDKLIKAYLMRESKKIALINQRLYALYIICAILFVVALVVFLLEILSVRYKNLQWLFV